MVTLSLFQVDAFTDHVFGGNPASVCPLPHWLPDATLQAITIEHNQSETAFFVPAKSGFELRWFTTSNGEIDLCGHATLASAHVIFNHLYYPQDSIEFTTRQSGILTVGRNGDLLTLDFPAWLPERLDDIPQAAPGGLGVVPESAYLKRDYLFVLTDEAAVRDLAPDFTRLAELDRRVCITAPGSDCDFVSRFFCPGDALEEDPVTGSTHCMLIPYWSARLGKSRLSARQLSKRGGHLSCEMRGDRVSIGGQARTYMQGIIFLP